MLGQNISSTRRYIIVYQGISLVDRIESEQVALGVVVMGYSFLAVDVRSCKIHYSRSQASALDNIRCPRIAQL